MPDASPYFRFCPKTVRGNLAWRARIRRAAIRNKSVQEQIRQACFDDPLFFISFAAWLIEPRAKGKVLPFVLWPHQVPAVLALVKSVYDSTENPDEPVDVVIDKSRTEGATWICLYVLLWFWLKDPQFAGGIISRSLEAVDKQNYKGSLFPKLDWAIDRLPFWLRPKGLSPKRDRSKTDHVWHNCENGATLGGTACTAEAFSGDRLTVLFYDECAKVKHADFQDAVISTLSVTNCRWFVSTHYRDSGPYYNMVYGKDAVGRKVILAWEDNPTKNRLAYTIRKGMPFARKIEDQAEVERYYARLKECGKWDKLRRRGFIKEGRVRSPWYDNKCLQEGATAQGIAQDLDRDPRGTVGKIFQPEILDHIAPKCQPPVWQGDVVVHDGELQLRPAEGGPLKLWFAPGLKDEPPKGKFVLGEDTATGLTGEGAGNASIIGGDAASGEQVLEYTDHVSETRLAHIAVALAEWLGDALMIWEAGGSTNSRFAEEVLKEIGYWNCYKRETVDERTQRKTTKYGWLNNMERHKVNLFGDLEFAFDEGYFVPRSAELIAECRGWERDETAKIVYHGTGHGDRAIAAGLCRKGMKEIGIAVDKGGEKAQTSANERSIAGRQAKRKESDRAGAEDDFAGFRRDKAGVW